MSGKPVDILAHTSTTTLGTVRLAHLNISHNQMIVEGLVSECFQVIDHWTSFSIKLKEAVQYQMGQTCFKLTNLSLNTLITLVYTNFIILLSLVYLTISL